MFDLDKAEPTTPLDTNAVIEHFFKSGQPFVLMTYGFKKLGNRVNQSSQAFKALAQVFQEVGENK